MIWQAMADFWAMVVEWVTGQFPGIPEPPAIITGGLANIGVVMSYVNSFCGWIDLGLAKSAVTFIVGVYFTGLLIRIIRIALGFFVG